MKCIFLNEKDGCYAEYREAQTWKVDAETKKRLCTMNSFQSCPRFQGKLKFQTHGHIKHHAKK